MPDLSDQHKSILKSYSRAIVHMRRQVCASRFGMVFGAGLSKGFGIPNWAALVADLAKEPEIQGEEVLKMAPSRTGLPYQTEMLFEHFRRRRYAVASSGQHHTRALDYRIGADWRELVRKHLYAKVTGDIAKLLPNHPYLGQ